MKNAILFTLLLASLVHLSSQFDQVYESESKINRTQFGEYDPPILIP